MSGRDAHHLGLRFCFSVVFCLILKRAPLDLSLEGVGSEHKCKLKHFVYISST